MLEFLQENWRLLLEGILVIFSFVFCLIRKKPINMIDSIKEMISSWLPYVINEAENTGLSGDEKLNFCISTVYDIFVKDYFSYNEYLIRYRDYLVDRVEEILSTPQKKGDLYGKR